MATILVVDDAAVDRRLVGGLLEKEKDFEIEFAVNGADALAKMKSALPDLVVTDLIMPEMDGLELVGAARREYPLVPVILMTSRGSEEISVRALQQGAASYVPKRLLGRDLVETAHKVLAASRRERVHWRLMDCMVRTETAFELENDSTLFRPLINYFQDCVTHLRLCDESERTRVGVALEEALANALYHGNLEIDSRLRDSDDRAYYEQIEQRRRISPYRERRIHVGASLSRKEAVFIVGDEGSGFNLDELPDPTDPENLDKASGRGILLMRTFMDQVAFNDAGNVVTLVKRCERELQYQGSEAC